MTIIAVPCSGAAEVSRARYVMGTVCEIRAEASHAQVTSAFEELERWEQVLSLFRPDSELSRLNARLGDWAVISPSLFEAVSKARLMAERTGGRFDPTLRPHGWRSIELDPTRKAVRLRFPLDLNGIGKGLALDHAAAKLPRRALLNFGGQVLAKGRWKVKTPEGFLYIENRSIATSGDEEHPGHIIDPLTGRSVRAKARWAIAATGWEADALSKAAYLQGENIDEDRTAVVGAGPAR